MDRPPVILSNTSVNIKWSRFTKMLTWVLDYTVMCYGFGNGSQIFVVASYGFCKQLTVVNFRVSYPASGFIPLWFIRLRPWKRKILSDFFYKIIQSKKGYQRYWMYEIENYFVNVFCSYIVSYSWKEATFWKLNVTCRWSKGNLKWRGLRSFCLCIQFNFLRWSLGAAHDLKVLTVLYKNNSG